MAVLRDYINFPRAHNCYDSAFVNSAREKVTARAQADDRDRRTAGTTHTCTFSSVMNLPLANFITAGQVSEKKQNYLLCRTSLFFLILVVLVFLFSISLQQLSK